VIAPFVTAFICLVLQPPLKKLAAAFRQKNTGADAPL